MASPPPDTTNPPSGFNIYVLIVIATFLTILLIAALLIYLCQGSTAESFWQCLTCRTGRRQVAVEPVEIPVRRYRKDQSFSSECSVCLTAFQDGEKVRQLPSCRHSFHAPCVDMWLYSHPSCPSCRAPVPQARRERIEDVEDSRLHQQQMRGVAVAISSVI